MKKWLAVVAAAGVLAGCGGGEEDASAEQPEATPSAPTAVTVNVTLKDAVPLGVLRNGGSGVCTSVDLVAVAFEEDTSPVEVTLRDAAGVIVATETLEEAGGSYGDGTCTWPLAFTVDHSDFYEVTVTWHDGSKTATGQTVGAGASVVVAL